MIVFWNEASNDVLQAIRDRDADPGTITNPPNNIKVDYYAANFIRKIEEDARTENTINIINNIVCEKQFDKIKQIRH